MSIKMRKKAILIIVIATAVIIAIGFLIVRFYPTIKADIEGSSILCDSEACILENNFLRYKVRADGKANSLFDKAANANAGEYLTATEWNDSKIWSVDFYKNTYISETGTDNLKTIGKYARDNVEFFDSSADGITFSHSEPRINSAGLREIDFIWYVKSGNSNPSFTLTLTLAVSGSKPLIYTSYSIENNGLDVIENVTPVIYGNLPLIKDNHDSYLVLPRFTGAVIDMPALHTYSRGRFTTNSSDTDTYISTPFESDTQLGNDKSVGSMQFIGAKIRNSGILVYSTDVSGNVQRFGSFVVGSNDPNLFNLYARQSIWVKPGEKYSLPYSLRTEVKPDFTYQQMAAEYAGWARDPGQNPKAETWGKTFSEKASTRPLLNNFRNGLARMGYGASEVTPEVAAYDNYDTRLQVMDFFEKNYRTKPVFWFWGDWPGYGINFPNYEINPLLGGAEDIKRLTAGARDRGQLAMFHINPNKWNPESGSLYVENKPLTDWAATWQKSAEGEPNISWDTIFDADSPDRSHRLVGTSIPKVMDEERENAQLLISEYGIVNLYFDTLSGNLTKDDQSGASEILFRDEREIEKRALLLQYRQIMGQDAVFTSEAPYEKNENFDMAIGKSLITNLRCSQANISPEGTWEPVPLYQMVYGDTEAMIDEASSCSPAGDNSGKAQKFRELSVLNGYMVQDAGVSNNIFQKGTDGPIPGKFNFGPFSRFGWARQKVLGKNIGKRMTDYEFSAERKIAMWNGAVAIYNNSETIRDETVSADFGEVTVRGILPSSAVTVNSDGSFAGFGLTSISVNSKEIFHSATPIAVVYDGEILTVFNYDSLNSVEASVRLSALNISRVEKLGYPALGTTDVQLDASQYNYANGILNFETTLSKRKQNDSGSLIDYRLIGVSSGSNPPQINSINLVDGQRITTNPYLIIVNATDDTSVSRVDFYVDDIIIGSNTMPDNDNNFEIPWDTGKYQSRIKVVAYDSDGNSASAERTTTVNLDPDKVAPPLIILPKTGAITIKNFADVKNIIGGYIKRIVLFH